MTFSTGAAGQQKTNDLTNARRKDAQRNYDRLLAEARVVVAENGAGASLEEIARRAELGIATLYRHFPTRTELMRALYEQALHEIIVSASGMLDAESAWHGVVIYIESAADWLMRDPGLPSIIEYMGSAEPSYRPAARFENTIAELIARAQADGDLRADVDGVDIAVLITMLGSLSSLRGAENANELQWRRQLSIMLDGLRATNMKTELPGESLDVDSFHHAVHRTEAR